LLHNASSCVVVPHTRNIFTIHAVLASQSMELVSYAIHSSWICAVEFSSVYHCSCSHSGPGLIHDMNFMSRSPCCVYSCRSAFMYCCILSRRSAFMYCWCMQGTVTDTAGKVNLAVSSLSFTRVAYPLLSGTSYEVIKSPGLLTLT